MNAVILTSVLSAANSGMYASTRMLYALGIDGDAPKMFARVNSRASGLTGFIAWIGIAVSHYRFRRAFKAQGHDLSELKYKAKWFPFGPLLALVLCILVIIGQDIQSFKDFNWQAIGVSYMSVPLFIILYAYYKIKYKTKVIPLDKVDLTPHDISKEKMEMQEKIDESLE